MEKSYCKHEDMVPLADSCHLLPDGREFEFWDDATVYERIYYVDCKAEASGNGSAQAPFQSIGMAAAVVKPREKVIIREGIYRETVRPVFGGYAPDSMIMYEAEQGAKVEITGAEILPGAWRPSDRWNSAASDHGIYMTRLDGHAFSGANPFNAANTPDDTTYFPVIRMDSMSDLIKKPAMVFCDGKILKQADKYGLLDGASDAWWAERDGKILHVRLANGENPAGHTIEVTARSQCFAPLERGMGYIRIRGLKFTCAGNAFPVPQEGMVSTCHGHHWIIEDCVFNWANSIALDIGKQSWNAPSNAPDKRGFHIVRRNTVSDCGLCGMAGFQISGTLVENNLVQRTGRIEIETIAESAAMKFHLVEDSLLRRNTVRDIISGCGIWLDYTNVNSRVTRNIAWGITTANGAIFVEASLEPNMVDNNLICDVRLVNGAGGLGIYAFGTQKLIVINNTIVNANGAGYFCNATPTRVILGQSGTGRFSYLRGNIFAGCGRSAIEIPDEHADIDCNLYMNMTEAYLRIGTSTIPHTAEEVGMKHVKMLCNLSSWREFFGFDKNGSELQGILETAPTGDLSLRLSFGGEERLLSREDVFEGRVAGDIKSVTGPRPEL